MELTDIQQYVWKAVSELPERQGEIVRRYYLERESLTHIAEEKGVSVQNIQERKRQGIQMLRKNRELREFYREYSDDLYTSKPLYLSYWKTSPERYAIEKDIYNRRRPRGRRQYARKV